MTEREAVAKAFGYFAKYMEHGYTASSAAKLAVVELREGGEEKALCTDCCYLSQPQRLCWCCQQHMEQYAVACSMFGGKDPAPEHINLSGAVIKCACLECGTRWSTTLAGYATARHKCNPTPEPIEVGQVWGVVIACEANGIHAGCVVEITAADEHSVNWKDILDETQPINPTPRHIFERCFRLLDYHSGRSEPSS